MKKQDESKWFRRMQNCNVHQDIAREAIKLETKEIYAGHWQDGHCAHYNIVKGTVY